MSHGSRRSLLGCLPLPPALVLFVVFAPFAALAAGPERARGSRETLTIQTDLVTPFFGAYLLEANVRVSNHFALLFNTSYLTLDNESWESDTGTLGLGLSYYFQGDALRRWYVQAIGEVMLSSWRHEPSGAVAPVTLGVTGVAIAGYRFICSAGPVLDLGAGAVVLHSPSARAEAGDEVVASQALTRVYPAAKLSVGWAF